MAAFTVIFNKDLCILGDICDLVLHEQNCGSCHGMKSVFVLYFILPSGNLGLSIGKEGENLG